MSIESDRQLLSMMSSRRGVGRPNFNEVTSMLRAQVPPVRDFSLAAVSDNQREALKRSLASLKAHVSQPEKPNPAESAGLTAWYLYATVVPGFVEQTRRADMTGNLPFFRFCYDFTRGMMHVLNDVISAHGEIEGDTTDDKAKQYYAEMDAMSGTNLAEERFARGKTRAQAGSNLLREDPSGFSLVDSSVMQLRRLGVMEDPCQAKAYVIAGAELIKDLYKPVYDIAKDLD